MAYLIDTKHTGSYSIIHLELDGETLMIIILA